MTSFKLNPILIAMISSSFVVGCTADLNKTTETKTKQDYRQLSSEIMLSEAEEDAVRDHYYPGTLPKQVNQPKPQRLNQMVKKHKAEPSIVYPSITTSSAGSAMPPPAKEISPSRIKPAQTFGHLRMANEPVNRENYAQIKDNQIFRALETPVSTFSIDVDTGSYSNVRRLLNNGALPNPDAVRVEELINYFSYQYPTPKTENMPFGVTTEIAPTPWNEKTHLLHIGVKGYDLDKNELPASNLVFLVDISGSMQSANKLGLLKSAIKLLTRQMRSKDRISLVVYAGSTGIVLEPTSGKNQAKISSAIDSLTAGGSTNGGAGIKLAYSMAEQAFIKNGVNRIILATDGDFNVGTTNFSALKSLVEEKRKSGIALTTLGFGRGNYNDKLMEQLADAGNGNYAYIDRLSEAKKVLVDEMSATLKTIAKDVKIQIEFNPQQVEEYRLIGYVNRVLKREDFNNDKIDAGEIGAGHTVTAIYEVALTGNNGQLMDPLRYTNHNNKKREKHSNELAFFKIRYKKPGGDISQLQQWAISSDSIKSTLNDSSDRFRFSAAVAAFGQKLRGGKYLNNMTYQHIKKMAVGSKGEDQFGYRGGFLDMVGLADALSTRRVSQK